MYVQLVEPNTGVEDYAGFCLRFTQSVFGAPAKYRSAWDAWKAATGKHENRLFPDAAVPVWFSHFGSYGEPPIYDNWGHVVAWIPGRGFLSSPLGKLGTYGQSWFGTLEEVERAFNAKFVGWSENINGLQVVEYKDDPKPQGDGVEFVGLCIVANEDQAGHFAVYSDYAGWKNLDFGAEGNGEMGGYQKIADAMNAGKAVPVALLSGEQWIYTQGHATRK